MVIIDHFSKWVELFPMKNQEAITVAKCIMEVIYKHGVPLKILTDQGVNFQSKLMGELYALLDIHPLRTTTYHPECDGQTERFNRTLESMISCFIDENQKNWDQLLSGLAFAYRSSVHSTIGCSAFEVGMEDYLNFHLI